MLYSWFWKKSCALVTLSLVLFLIFKSRSLLWFAYIFIYFFFVACALISASMSTDSAGKYRMLFSSFITLWLRLVSAMRSVRWCQTVSSCVKWYVTSDPIFIIHLASFFIDSDDLATFLILSVLVLVMSCAALMAGPSILQQRNTVTL